MTILIVGGAGYIGSHMVRFLLEHTGYEVIVVDNLSKGHQAAVSGAKLVVGDFGESLLIESLCRQHNVNAVMHFGADSLVGESVNQPAKYYDNNIIKGKRLVDAMLAAGVQHLIFSSTAAVYGEPVHLPIGEDDPLSPTNPYGRTKLAFEGLLESYRAAYGLNYCSLRYFNAAGAHPSGEIGEDHSPETHLIPIVLQAALGQSESVSIYGMDYQTDDGTCIRDYVHVDDLADAHLLALKRIMQGGSSGVYNLGNSQGFSVREIIQICREVTGHHIPETITPRRTGDPAVLVASAELARRELGWRPKRQDIREIVSSAWEWHRKHPHGFGV